MIRLLKALYERKLSEAERDRVQNDAHARLITEASEVVTERPDRDGWVRMSQANDREKGLLLQTQLEMVRQARKFARFDPNARGALTTMVNYIMGKGLTITPKSQDPKVWYVWREFWTSPRNRMDLRQFEIVGRTLRDGELFIEFFTQTDGNQETGKTTVRFIDSLLVRSKDTPKDPTKTIDNGVNTDPEDVEKVISYTVQSVNDDTKFRDVPAEKVHHIKANADSDQKRGETQLLSIMNMLKHYEQWLQNRIILNKMRSAIVLIKKVEGTPTEVAAMADTIPSASRPSGSSEKQMIKGGTMVTEGPGVTYRMEAPNINANDVKEDGRNIKLNMAAGLNLPEYIFGDASNQNYASSLIAESPFVKAIEFWQIFFEYHFAQIYRRVIEAAVKAGQLEAPNDDEFLSKLDQVRKLKEAEPPEPPEGDDDDAEEGGVPAGEDGKAKPKLSPKQVLMQELMPNGRLETPSEVFFGCDMTWPEIVHRDLKQHAEALALARQNGWIADSTACSALGYDYGEEVRKQRQTEEEAQQAPNPLLGLGGEAGDSFAMDAEMEDMLNGLSPEEREGVLKAKDPREVVKIIGRKKAAGAAKED